MPLYMYVVGLSLFVQRSCVWLAITGQQLKWPSACSLSRERCCDSILGIPECSKSQDPEAAQWGWPWIGGKKDIDIFSLY